MTDTMKRSPTTARGGISTVAVAAPALGVHCPKEAQT
jgi:hypothetical protein